MQNSRIITALFNGLLFSTGLGLAAYQGYDCLLYSNSTQWQQTTGKIMANGIEEIPARVFLVCGPESKTEKKSKKRVVRYTYSFQGEVRESEKVAFGELGFLNYLQLDLGGYLEKYPVGSDVQVFCNPLNPDYAVLERTLKQEGTSVLGISVFMIVIGAGSFLTSRRDQFA